MKLDKHERARPNVAGLTSPVQRAEMDLLVAARWPALKPLPVFRYESKDYRATIHFDKTRGEWVCRKTFLAADEPQEVRKDSELRGGLTEMTMTLPHGKAKASSEPVGVEPPKLASEYKLHLEAVLAWRENYGNGAVYAGLQDYLSEDQQEEVYEIVRTSLTAWQLQFNPKNIAFIFDVLWNSGGRLTKLIQIARLKEAGARREEAPPAESADEQNSDWKVEFTPQQSVLRKPAGACTGVDDSTTSSAAEIPDAQVSQSLVVGTASRGATSSAPERLEIHIPKVSADLTLEPARSFVSTKLASFAAESIENFSSEDLKTAPQERIAQSKTQACDAVGEIPCTSRGSFVEIFRDRTPYAIPLFGLRKSRVRGGTSETETPRSAEDSPQLFVSEKPAKKRVGLRIAAIAFLAVGFTIGFTVGLNTPIIPPETEEPNPEKLSSMARPADSVPPAKAIRPVSGVASPSHLDSNDSSGAQKQDETTVTREESKEGARDSETFAELPSGDSISFSAIELEGTHNHEASAKRDDSSRLVARNVSPRALQEPNHSDESADSMTRTTRSITRGSTKGTTRPPTISTTGDARMISAVRGVAPALRTTLHPPLSSAILVTAPAEGGRSLKLTLPEKPVAVSSSFAISSQFSVLIAPEPGSAATHHPARLQAGKLVSYVWPHYPKPGNRNESTETVKVRATIGRFGQVTDVKRVNGSSSLFAAAISAIRLWHFQPTLLNKRPVQAMQDVTIEFRPPRYSSQVSPQHASPN